MGVAAAAAAAQDPPLPDAHGGRPTVRAERLEAGERIVLDGRLDEPVWQRADPADAFLQQEPVEGGPPSERTEVRVAFDRNALYLGVRAFDDPSGILAFQRQRDAGLGSDDRFMWVIDTFLDGRSAYFFEINPAGLMGDGLLRVGSGNSLNKSWDGIWEARVGRDAKGWTAEIRIPFRTLNFDPGLDAWGINFQRTIRRRNEELLWSGHRRTQGLFRPVHAGRLVGLSGLSQGLGLEARPYSAASVHDAGAAARGQIEVGADIGYSLTPGLRAALTLNTDFAETDVDDRQVNLTRFPLQFPEKRQFFLEGSGVYSFAPASGVNPYFSRRIGLAADGRPVPIVYGARLGGQAGAYDLGLLQIRTGARDDVPAETFTVGRIRRNILAQSAIGLVYTRRATDGTPDRAGVPVRQTLGADLELTTSHFLGRYNAQFESFYVWHTDPRSTGTPARERTARGLRVSFPNDVWQGHVSFREFGREWDPAVGFAPRRGFRRVQPTVGWHPRPGGRLVRQLQFQGSLEYLTDLAGRLETQRVSATPIGVALHSGDEAGVEVTSMVERIDEPFKISEGVAIPPGTYRFTDVEASVRTARRRRISGSLEWRGGEFWSGERTRLEGDLTLRPFDGVTLTAEWEHQAVALLEGRFTTRLLRLRASWHASPWTSLTTITQFDNVSDRLGLYARLRWIVRPGSDLYLVYTHDWRQAAGAWTTVSRGGTAKVNVTHRF
jgi:hypothetical protein